MSWELDELKNRISRFEYSKADRYEVENVATKNRQLNSELTTLRNEVSYLRERIEKLEQEKENQNV